MTAVPHVVILGGGFGGLNAAKALAKAPVRVTLIDRRNHHLFQPLLYQVATAGLTAAEIGMPIRKILRSQENATVLLAEAVSVDVARKVVVLADGEVAYDFLIVATGATHAYFGHDEWAEFAPGLKSIEDAFEIRRRVYLAFERAERTLDRAEQAAYLTFVVVGAGPTGVELAGTLREIATRTLAGDFRNSDPRSARIILVEGLDRVLPSFPPELSEKAREQLADLGVEVRLKSFVTEISDAGVKLGGTEFIACSTVLWAAGVRASPLGATLGAPLERNGQVKVTPTLNVPGREDIFVIGDLASIESDGQRVPGMAPAAIQMARLTARNIERKIAGQSYEPFHYVNKGMMATVGRSAAVAVIGKVMLSGFLAWLAWLLVHLVLLIGFRNRIFTLLNWAWAYFTYQRGGRLILETAAEVHRRLTAGDGEEKALPAGEKRPEAR